MALVCGLANSAAAVLEKREGMKVAALGSSGPLLTVLLRRRWWLVAMVLSALAWGAEAAALGLAPVPVVTTLRSVGRGGLVIAGHRWLGERFGRLELAGIGLLAAGGILTASSVTSQAGNVPPISNAAEVIVAATAALVAGLLSRRRSGVSMGCAVGVLFAATGVLTKEVGDRFVRDGFAAVPHLAATPGPWVMVVLSVWAVSILQEALLAANAATVAAASATVSANGLVVASLGLYHQPVAVGNDVVFVAVGLVLSALGAVTMAKAGPLAAWARVVRAGGQQARRRADDPGH